MLLREYLPFLVVVLHCAIADIAEGYRQRYTTTVLPNQTNTYPGNAENLISSIVSWVKYRNLIFCTGTQKTQSDHYK